MLVEEPDQIVERLSRRMIRRSIGRNPYSLVKVACGRSPGAWKSGNRECPHFRADTGEASYLPGHTQNVATLAWDKDGNTIASLGNDDTLRLWDARLATPYTE